MSGSESLDNTPVLPDCGLVIVVTGDGKGKTTAALGMALRALGHGMKVVIVQFIKGTMYSGEIDALSRFEGQVELIRSGRGFVRGIKGEEELAPHREAARVGLGTAKEKMASGDVGLLILDEIMNAINLGLLDEGEVVSLIKEKPEGMHLVLTGRGAPTSIIDLADTVSEIGSIKHAMDRGTAPQAGADY